jgi:hypothetical protein
MNKSIMAIALSGVLVTSACASTGGKASGEATGSNRPAVTSSSSSSSSVESEPVEETPTDEGTTEDPAQDTELKFGEPFTWEDGLSMTVSKPKKYNPDSDMGYDYGIKLTVTIVNKTGKRFDPSMFTASMQKGNEEAEEIFDSANGVEGAPSTKLLNGREAKFVIAFEAKTSDDLVLEVAPSFEHESVIYTK